MKTEHPQTGSTVVLVALLAATMANQPLLGQTATFTPSKDNTIYQSTTTSGQESNGQGSFLFAGRNGQAQTMRALIAFDLTSIPANATITGVSLALFDSTPKAGAATISLRKVLRDWGEGASVASSGEGGGAPATTGDASWLYNFFNTSMWTTAGGDFDAATSASVGVNEVGRVYNWSDAGMVTDVQGWVADPATNFGWGLISNQTSGAHRFDSGESGGNAPRLSVTYTTPTASPTPTPPGETPPQLLNVSTRLRVETGENALIGGFIVTGNQPKRVILRALGPSLAQSGVAAPVADPTLELVGGDNVSIAFNDNWKDSQQAEIAASTIPPSNDAEAAIVRTLSPGNYTAVVRGKDNTTGVGLVEAYDLDRSPEARLANISTRGLVQTGTNVMIGGFIIGGDAPAKVIVRAIGPSLSQTGVSNPLADPTLQLFDNNGTELEANDNWRDDPDQAEIAAAGVAPQNNLESALLANIPAGNYTAVVAGKNSGTGVGLVEVYHLR